MIYGLSDVRKQKLLHHLHNTKWKLLHNIKWIWMEFGVVLRLVGLKSLILILSSPIDFQGGFMGDNQLG